MGKISSGADKAFVEREQTRQALKIAVRALCELDAEEALDAIMAIDEIFVSTDFLAEKEAAE